MFTGRTPFDDAGSLGSILTKITIGQTPKLDEEPTLAAYPELRALLEKCWDMEPEARPTIKEAIAVVQETVSAWVFAIPSGRSSA